MWLKKLQEAYDLIEAPKPKKLSKLREGKYWYVPNGDSIKSQIKRYEEKVGSIGILNIDMPVDYSGDVYQDHREVAQRLVGGEKAAMRRGWLRVVVGDGGGRGGISLWSMERGVGGIVSDVVKRMQDISFIMEVSTMTVDIYSGYNFENVGYMVDVDIESIRSGDVMELSKFNISPRSSWAN